MQEGQFMRVPCTCGRDDVYLKCDQCGQRADFTKADGVTCACGASYGHAVCLCGEKVAAAALVAVPFEQGPRSMEDMEIAWPRVLALVLGVAALLAGATVWLT